MLILCTLSFCLPALLLGLGQYRVFLSLALTGTATALFLAHVLPVSAYMFILLQGPYRSFDTRWSSSSAGLGIAQSKFLLQVKWPMLKSSLLAAMAVGFAVSVAQYVPAQLAAAGRFSTLPMEAVTLTSGGNRALIATYGIALTALPLMMFLVASWFGRPRWSQR
jgi:putative thiamine transport system permease protein